MLGDIQPKQQTNGFGLQGSENYAVLAGATAINAGEPILKALGAPSVTVMTTNKPVVATDFLAGIAATTSTQTASVAGTVQIIPLTTAITWLIAPNVAATWNTQAKYDALVGARVLIDLTTGTYTILATDGATNGCVVEPLDISLFPGKVAFKFRAGCSYLA